MQQQISYVANQALHSALELIDPAYIEFREKSDEGTLGSYCFSGLFSLGYWKKLTFLNSREMGLWLASTLMDYSLLRQLYQIR